MQARLDLCVAKGFSVVEPDNTDAYQQDTGMTLDRFCPQATAMHFSAILKHCDLTPIEKDARHTPRAPHYPPA